MTSRLARRYSAKPLYILYACAIIDSVIQSFGDAVIDLTDRALARSVYIDTNVLALLGSYRATLEDVVVGLERQAAELSTNPYSWFLGPRFNVCIPAASLGEIWGSLNPEISSLPHPEGQHPNADHNSWLCSDFNQVPAQGPLLPFCLVPSPKPNPAVCVASGRCGHCMWQGGLVEKPQPLGCASLGSTWCPVCGSSTNTGLSTYLVSAIVPLVYLAQFLLCEALSRSEDLLRLVISAVAVLFSRLRSAAFRHKIAISQRSFFTHHGAHPPRVQPPRQSGLLPGKVFQPQIAA